MLFRSGVVTIIYLLIALVAWQVMHRIEQAARLPSLATGKART